MCKCNDMGCGVDSIRVDIGSRTHSFEYDTKIFFCVVIDRQTLKTEAKYEFALNSCPNFLHLFLYPFPFLETKRPSFVIFSEYCCWFFFKNITRTTHILWLYT